MKQGFTLIELLIVISILALLSAIGLTVYTNVLKNARDSQRKTDIGFIQSALEQYFADQFFYPQTLSIGSAFTNCTGNITPCTVTKTYINSVPAEPISSRSQYSYQALPAGCDQTATKCTSYCIYVSAENVSGSLPSGCSAPAASPTAYNFAVTKP